MIIDSDTAPASGVPTLRSARRFISMDDVAVANLITERLTLHHASFHYSI